MTCAICHTDHAPYQAHVFPSQRQGTAPHAGLHARTCAECATLRAKIAELRAENDGLRAALDMAMESVSKTPVSTANSVSKRSANKPANADANKVDRKAYMRELMRKRRAAAKQG